jgi:Zn-finger nucleic acid-binding protein
MRCANCGTSLDIRGVFPGALVACTCGGEGTVTVRDALSLGSPYRAPAMPSYGALPTSAPRKARPRTSSLRRCPRCSIAMPVPVTETDEPSECDRCHGMFVPWELLSVALSRARAHELPDHESAPAAGVLDEVVYLPCPACGERMNRTLYSPRSRIIVDVCSEDGLWFDPGEIERAVHYPMLNRPSLAPRSPSRPSIEPGVLPAGEIVVDFRGRATFVDRLVDFLFDLLVARRP